MPKTLAKVSTFKAMLNAMSVVQGVANSVGKMDVNDVLKGTEKLFSDLNFNNQENLAQGMKAAATVNGGQFEIYGDEKLFANALILVREIMGGTYHENYKVKKTFRPRSAAENKTLFDAILRFSSEYEDPDASDDEVSEEAEASDPEATESESDKEAEATESVSDKEAEATESESDKEADASDGESEMGSSDRD